MGLCRSSVFLLGFLLLQQSHSSLVKLNNNGYEDIVIAIDPIVPEDEALIEKIQDMVTEASEYLFEATEQRFFFKNVSILIPWTWKENPQYKDPKYESFTRADVKVAPPVVAGEDDPYTRQFKECGEQADYIHFTPDFVLGNKQDEYGPSGRVFVHEWAHLRWGVFDEYNNDEPFYRDSSNKIEATRCSADITGTNAVYVCSGGSCVNRRCRTNSTTNLYEKDCQFFPDKDQLQKASIMYMQSIESITEFCNEKNHNQEAPSLQNKKCDSRSTWEVISVSEDFRNTTPMVELPPPTAFSLLRSSQRILCLVLDKSGSMGGYDRLNRMNQAATYFLLQVIEYASLVGMVHFSSVATTQSELIQITSSSERDQLKNTLPSGASGGTCICCGITKAFEVFRRHNSEIDGCEIVLLTDGEDSTAGNCINEVAESGTIVHLIALGPNAELAVKNMPTITGGTHYYASDEAQNNGLMDAFGSLASGNTDLFQKSIQLESKGLKLNSNTWMNDTVIIDSTVGNDTFFLITWQKQQPEISLLDPNGTSMKTFTVDSASKMAYLSVPGTAKVGIWTYSVQAKADSEILTITITSRAANSTVPPITVNAKMSKDSNSFPNPMVVYAEVLQGYTPVLGANVTAYIESQTGTTQVLQLWDNGAGADVFKNDGVYSRYFTNYTENGRYSLKVRAYGGTNSATRSLQRPLNRAIYIPGWVVNGVIEGKPPRPETNEATQTTLENFSRAVSGGAFVISNVSNNPFEDHYPPSQITDLDATFDGDEITLSWTAPGENFDSGTAQRYIIRTSKNILHLRDNFTNALLVNTTALSPKEANSKETFRFKPENAEEENTTFIFVAIQSVDKSNLHSKISNIAQVALFIPEADPGPEENPGSGGNPGSDGNPSQSGVNISVMVLSVVGSVVVVTVIVSSTICILNKRRARLQRIF